MRSRSRYYSFGGRLLALTNLEKVIYPQTGFKKKDLLNYYRRIAPTVLPHLRDRPFTLNRFPNGVEEPGFFEKQCPSHRPGWIETAEFGETRYCLVNSLAALLWVANLAAIELHTTLATARDLARPTSVIFDLDPGEGAGIHECAEVSLLLRGLLEHVGLQSFAKTSGKKGLHVHVPLNSEADYRQTQGFAKRIAETLEVVHSDLVVSKMTKALRSGKVLIDWSQNTDFKTTATVYSLRVGAAPTVSLPITWEETRGLARSGSKSYELLSLSPEDVLKRVERRGDIYSPVLKLRQNLGRRVLPTLALARDARSSPREASDR